jgi:stringent starvation protein B
MSEASTKPYLIRAIHEWCTDSGLTPYIAVLADEGVRVPLEFVKNGEIVLNISPLATSRLQLGNEAIEFHARFGGIAREVWVPIEKVLAVYARENGQGMAFDVPRGTQPAGLEATTEAPADRRPAPTPMTLVSVRPGQPTSVGQVSAVPAPAADSEPDDTPPSPRAGDRPHLTRVK